jgi:hypothetical protein
MSDDVMPQHTHSHTARRLMHHVICELVIRLMIWECDGGPLATKLRGSWAILPRGRHYDSPSNTLSQNPCFSIPWRANRAYSNFGGRFLWEASKPQIHQHDNCKFSSYLTENTIRLVKFEVTTAVTMKVFRRSVLPPPAGSKWKQSK